MSGSAPARVGSWSDIQKKISIAAKGKDSRRRVDFVPPVKSSNGFSVSGIESSVKVTVVSKQTKEKSAKKVVHDDKTIPI